MIQTRNQGFWNRGTWIWRIAHPYRTRWLRSVFGQSASNLWNSNIHGLGNQDLLRYLNLPSQLLGNKEVFDFLHLIFPGSRPFTSWKTINPLWSTGNDLQIPWLLVASIRENLLHAPVGTRQEGSRDTSRDPKHVVGTSWDKRDPPPVVGNPWNMLWVPFSHSASTLQTRCGYPPNTLRVPYGEPPNSFWLLQ